MDKLKVKDIELWFIVLSYNSSASVNETLLSITRSMDWLKGQQIQFGVILCDDASIDGTDEILEDYKKAILIKYGEEENFLNINVIKNKINRGTVLNLDNGLNYLNKIIVNNEVDRYLKIIGGDDEIIQDEFNLALRLVEKIRPDVQFNAVQVCDLTKNATYTNLSPQLWTYKSIIGRFMNLKNNLIMSPSTIIKLDLALNINEKCKSIGIKLIEDWMISSYAYNFSYIKILRTRYRVVKYNIRGSSVTMAKNNEISKVYDRDIYLQQKFNFKLVNVEIDNIKYFKKLNINFFVRLCLFAIKFSNNIEKLVFLKR